MFGPFVLQRRCQVYKSEFEYWATLFFFFHLKVLCLLQILHHFRFVTFISHTKPTISISVSLSTSWKYLFKIKVISLKDMRATLHRLLFYEFSKRILTVWNTGHFHGNRLQWGRAKLILSVSLPSMNFLLPFCHQWSRQPWKVIINRLWQPQPLSAATSTWRGGNYKLFITDEVKKQVNPHTAEHICMSAHI